MLWLLVAVLPLTAQQALSLSRNHLDFDLNSLPWGATSEPQSFTVASADSNPVDFQVTLDGMAGWMVVDVSSYRTPAVITVRVRAYPGAILASFISLVPSRGNSVLVPVTFENWTWLYPSSDTISPTTVDWTFTQGGSRPSTLITVNGGTATPGFQANAMSDGNWLQLNGSYTYTGPGPFTLGCLCSQLAPGKYSGIVKAGNKERSTITVSLTVNPPPAGSLTAGLGSLAFDYQVGSPAPTPQNVAVSSTGAASSFRTSASTQTGNWLSVTPASAATPSSISVSVNPAGLSQASYSGTVTLTPSSGAAISLPVTLTVRAAAPLAASASTLAFTYRLGDPAPETQTLQLSGGGPSPSFTVQVPDTARWLKVSPLAGTAPAAIAVSVDPGKLAAGNYQAALTVTGTGSAGGSVAVPIVLQVTTPLPTVLKVVQAASYAAGAVAPGEIVTLFGANIGPDSLTGLALDATGKVASSLNGVQVLFDGTPAPLIYVSKTQIAAVAPYELAGLQDTTVQVSWSGQRSNGVTLPVATTAPGIFTANASGTGLGAIAHANGSINAPENPAAPGDTVVVYITGEGQTSPKGVTGKVTTVSDVPPLTPAPVLPIAVLIGGQPAQVLFAGEAPGFVSGILQLNVQIPSNARPGDLPITVSVGGNSSQPGVTISISATPPQ